MRQDGERAWRRYHMLIAAVIFVIIVVDIVIIAHRFLGTEDLELQLDAIRDLKLQLDPDIASAQALAELPGLNIRQARGIVELRNRAGNRAPGQRFYASLEDIDAVRGIGPKTLEKIGDYLYFPARTDTGKTPN